MTVQFRSKGALVEATTTATTSVAVPTPAGFQAGDLLLMCLSFGGLGGSGATFPSSLPSGWGTLGTDLTGLIRTASAVYYKIASGSEGSSQTWSGISLNGAAFWDTRAEMLAFTGVDPSTPIKSGEWAVSSDNSITAAMTHPTVTPSVAGSGLVLFRLLAVSISTSRDFTSSITAVSNPAGVERSDPTTSNRIDRAIYTRDGGFSLAAQSYTTTASTTGSGGGNAAWSIVLAAAPPAVADKSSVGILYG